MLDAWPWLAHPIVGERELAAVARAIELHRQLGDRRALFAALCKQARFQPYCGRHEEAELSIREAEQLFEAGWPVAVRAHLLRARANLRDVQGRFEEAIAANQELLQLATALDDRRLALTALICLEQSEAALDRLEESVARGHEMIRLMEEDRTLRGGNEHFVLKNLHMSLARGGAVDEALEMAHRVYPILERVGRTHELMETCALLVFKRGRIDDAARMLGRSELSFAMNDIRRDPVEQQLRDDLVQNLGEALRARELSRLLKEGEALTDDEAIRLGLQK